MSMTITLILKEKKKSKVYLDGEFSFWLYQKEVREYDLVEGIELSQETIELIKRKTVLLYAKKQALSLLERMDRTEAELVDKLTKKEFPLDIAKEALAYVKSYNYVDDYHYTLNFVRGRVSTKSKKQISYALYQKGIAKEMIAAAYEELATVGDGYQTSTDYEQDAICKIIRKKGKPFSDYTREEKQKLLASLYRKGFSMSTIQKVLQMEFEIE